MDQTQTQPKTAPGTSTASGTAEKPVQRVQAIVVSADSAHHIPPGWFLILAALFTGAGIFCTCWQFGTTMVAFVMSFTGHKFYMITLQSIFGQLLPTALCCVIIAGGAQSALMYIVFQVRGNWSENAQGASGGLGGAIKHTGVEVYRQGALIWIWLMVGATVGILGDMTYVSNLTNDILNQAAYIFFLYMGSTFVLVIGLHFWQSYKIAFHKEQAWKKALYGAAKTAAAR